MKESLVQAGPLYPNGHHLNDVYLTSGIIWIKTRKGFANINQMMLNWNALYMYTGLVKKQFIYQYMCILLDLYTCIWCDPTSILWSKFGNDQLIMQSPLDV